jgi:ATP adenylyltransferase
METLWTPWRYPYIKSAGNKDERCILCQALSLEDDKKALILGRGKANFIILNLYPYNSGHLMVAPIKHLSSFYQYGKKESVEFIELAKLSVKILAEVYHPHGFNIGMNLGRPAGAGVTDHFHLHIVPRWNGDTNFMSVVGEVRLIPEDITASYEKLHSRFKNELGRLLFK